MRVLDVLGNVRFNAIVYQYIDGHDLEELSKDVITYNNNLEILQEEINKIENILKKCHICHNDMHTRNFFITLRDYNIDKVYLIDFEFAEYSNDNAVIENQFVAVYDKLNSYKKD